LYLGNSSMPKMKCLFVFLLALLPLCGSAQSSAQRQIDSLLIAASDTREDTGYALLLIKIDSLYNTVNPDLGITKGQQAEQLSNVIDFKRGVGLANMTIGLNYKYKAEYKKALPYLFTARTILEEEHALFDLADCLKYIGILYQDQHMYDTALSYYRQAIDIFQKTGSKAMIARVEGNICNLYESQANEKNDNTLLDSSLFYGQRALQRFLEMQDRPFIATALGNIGIVYKSKKMYDSALACNQRALMMFEVLTDKVGTAIVNGNIGEIYYSRALDSGNAYYTSLGAAYDTVQASDLKLAIEYCDKAISQAYAINQVENLLFVRPILANAYALSGDHKTAFETLLSHIATKDSAAKNEDITATATIASLRDLKILTQQSEIEQLKKQYQLTVAIASVIILIIVIVIVINRLVKHMASNKILAEEKKKHLEKIEEQATVLSDIAYTQSHDVRGEVATILGLAQIFNFDQPDDPNNKLVIEGIAEVTEKLDAVVKATIKKENELSNGITFNPNKSTL